MIKSENKRNVSTGCVPLVALNLFYFLPTVRTDQGQAPGIELVGEARSKNPCGQGNQHNRHDGNNRSEEALNGSDRLDTYVADRGEDGDTPHMVAGMLVKISGWWGCSRK
jgi:hypothetical protein